MFLSDDDMVECPYNKTHRMLRKRLQSHLIKCRLNYPDVELRKCPFNITHLIPEPEFRHHATNCPDRKLITQYKYDAPEQKEEEIPKHAPIECDDNWDDTDVVDYNPRLHLDKGYVIRQPDGANRSERKLFIKKERKRLGDGDDSSEEEDGKSGIIKRESPNSFEKELEFWKNRTKRSSSPSTSLYSRERSRSPINKSRRNRSRSPAGFSGSYRNNSPPLRRSPDSRRYSTPPNPVGRTLDTYNSDQDLYYNGGGGRIVNNDQYNSGRDAYYGIDNINQAYFDRNIETNSIMPQAPPPPMISYPSRRSYFPSKQPPASGR